MTPLSPILAGAGAGVLGGAGWALIVALTDLEVGWVAWGIGGLIGFAMTRTTAQRSIQLATIAAVIAILSLLIGKVLIQQFVTRPAFGRSLRESPQAVASAAAWRLREQESFPPELQARLDALAEADTLPDALWEEMVAAGQVHAATLTEADRAELATAYVESVQAQVTPWQQLRWGFSLWDLLWFGLAVSTAWGMLKPTAPVAAASSDAGP
jgi:hypothetical protein